MLFDNPPEKPETPKGPEWSLGCFGILSGVGINLVVLFVAAVLGGFLSRLPRFIGANVGLEFLVLLLLVDALVIAWGFKNKETSFAVGLVIAACLALLLFSSCGAFA
jgi:hypothetical protein